MSLLFVGLDVDVQLLDDQGGVVDVSIGQSKVSVDDLDVGLLLCLHGTHITANPAGFYKNDLTAL